MHPQSRLSTPWRHFPCWACSCLSVASSCWFYRRSWVFIATCLLSQATTLLLCLIRLQGTSPKESVPMVYVRWNPRCFPGMLPRGSTMFLCMLELDVPGWISLLKMILRFLRSWVLSAQLLSEGKSFFFSFLHSPSHNSQTSTCSLYTVTWGIDWEWPVWVMIRSWYELVEGFHSFHDSFWIGLFVWRCYVSVHGLLLRCSFDLGIPVRAFRSLLCVPVSLVFLAFSLVGYRRLTRSR